MDAHMYLDKKESISVHQHKPVPPFNLESKNTSMSKFDVCSLKFKTAGKFHGSSFKIKKGRSVGLAHIFLI